MVSVNAFEEVTIATVPGTVGATGDLRLPQESTLIVLNGPNAGTRVPIGEQVVVGRGPRCELRLLQGDISREHARITINRDGSYLLEDLGSRNGTHVDGVAIRRHVLRVGERVRFGRNAVVLFTNFGDVEDQILHKQKLESLGRLAGGVAHDFNNLLGAVLSNVSYLLEDYQSIEEGEIKATLEDIKTAANRAADLTRQLLGFARKGKYEHKATNLKELADDVLNILSRTIDPAIRLDASGDARVWVMGDRSQLHQVLLNLCINARDAMPKGGHIDVRVSSRDQHAIIEVTDDGCGMSPEVRDQVFEPFFTTKDVGSGTGLGLATVYGVVKNHGGEIHVESEVGRGTTFRIFMPLHERPEPKTELVEADANPVMHGTVLVVDDEDLHRRGCARNLRSNGFAVLTAQDGPEALKVYETHGKDIDVVLLDLRMPKMSGEEVARFLYAMNPNVRIVATSGYTDAKQANSLLDGLASGFLRKPFTPSLLTDAIHRAMRKDRLRAPG